jgi:hypothetical protein
MGIYAQGPADGILDNLAVLLAVANRDALQDNPRRSVTDNAAGALRKALKIGMSTPVDEIKDRLAAALERAALAAAPAEATERNLT